MTLSQFRSKLYALARFTLCGGRAHDIPHYNLRPAPVRPNRVGALVNHAKGVRY